MKTWKDAADITGRSVSWLKTRECGWCGQRLGQAIRTGCGAHAEDCEPLKRKPWWKSDNK
jgi:hypothetical protein